jgi:hypothetical protein
MELLCRVPLMSRGITLTPQMLQRVIEHAIALGLRALRVPFTFRRRIDVIATSAGHRHYSEAAPSPSSPGKRF